MYRHLFNKRKKKIRVKKSHDKNKNLFVLYYSTLNVYYFRFSNETAVEGKNANLLTLSVCYNVCMSVCIYKKG